jgi:hypothetical protein
MLGTVKDRMKRIRETISERKLTSSEIKIVAKSKKAAKLYTERNINPTVEHFGGVFATSSVEFSNFEKEISELYLSGDKNREEQLRVKEHLLDLYSKKAWLKSEKSNQEKPLEFRTTYESYALPREQCLFRYSSDESNIVSVELPNNFFYSYELSNDRNLKRRNGYINEPAYNNPELKCDNTGMGWWNRSFTELEAMRYFYDMAPYAMIYSRNHWVQALITANSGVGGKILIGIINTQPISLTGSNWIKYSSKCIPFEHEGRTFVVTVEELYEAILCNRKEDRLYSIGASDDAETTIVSLMLKERRSDIPIDKLVEFAKEYKKERKSFNDTFLPAEPPGQQLEEAIEVAYYYGSNQERNEMVRLLNISDSDVEILKMKILLDSRNSWYQFSLLSEGREGLNERKEAFAKRELELRLEFKNRYDMNIFVPEFPLDETKDMLDFSDDEEDGQFFGFMDEVEDIQDDAPEGMNPADNQLREFTQENSDWLTRQENGYNLARSVWDPGGGSMNI